MILLKFYGASHMTYYGDIPRIGEQIVEIMRVLTVRSTCVVVEGQYCWCDVLVY